MRIFYIFWFFFCASWGYLLPFATANNEKSIVDSVSVFPLALTVFGSMAFWTMISAKIQHEDARISLDIKPWERPLGIFVFVPVSFIFVSIWGMGFSIFLHDKGLAGSLEVFSMASGILTGAWCACHAYRHKRKA
jgi:hypothetical protein